ncbi:hypothetical protein [Candidatus Enterovibrio altilux]|nr:hypothetical protein [Candidatus Enterovibrio luxaltus]
MLKQIRRKTNEILVDGTYYTKQCYDFIRNKRRVPFTLPKEEQFF